MDPALHKEAYRLAQQLFGENTKAGIHFANHLSDTCARAQGKDFLIVHTPGGWGQTRLERCQESEQSLVAGINATIEEMGYSSLLTQYLRTHGGWQEQAKDIKEQLCFFASKSSVMAAWLQFIADHVDTINVILIGVSQGAAFSNAVMQKLGGLHHVYSIELGYLFPYRPWRIITERTLKIDSNGVMPDPMVHRNLKAGAKAFTAAPFRWVKHHMKGRAVSLSYCINVSGHDYSWDYPEVRRQIRDFIETNFPANTKPGDQADVQRN